MEGNMKALENKREKQEEFPEMSMRQRADIRARKRKKTVAIKMDYYEFYYRTLYYIRGFSC